MQTSSGEFEPSSLLIFCDMSWCLHKAWQVIAKANMASLDYFILKRMVDS